MSVGLGYHHHETHAPVSVVGAIDHALAHRRPASPISTISTISTSRAREREREHISYRRRIEEEARRSSRRHHEDDIRVHRHGDMPEFGQRRRGNVYERLGHRPESRREESHLVPVHLMRSGHDIVGEVAGIKKDDKAGLEAGEDAQKRKQLCPDYEGAVQE